MTFDLTLRKLRQLSKLRAQQIENYLKNFFGLVLYYARHVPNLSLFGGSINELR